MSKGGGTKESTQVNTTSKDPWAPQQEPLKKIYSEADSIYQTGAPKYYDGATVVDYSPDTEQALTMMRDRALAGSPLQDAASQQMQNTVDGNYLSGNPFFQGAFEAQVRPTVDQYKNQIAPGIDSSFNGANRMGSNAYATARNSADDTFARALSDTAGKLAYDNYGTERGMQMNAAATAPAFAQNDYANAQNLAAVGSARDAKAGEYMADNVNRWNFNENSGWDRLGKYAALVAGGNFGGTTSASTPIYSNKASGILGGAASGAGIGNMIGGGAGAGYGAALGGLLGAWG